MKKILISLSCILSFCACSDNKAKNKGAEEKEQVSTSATTGSANEDKAIVDWLVGKEWKAFEEAAPISILRFFSKDTCGFTTGRYAWSFEKGRFIMLAEWPLVRVNDTTFTLYVEPTKRTFAYRLVKNL